MSDKTQEEATMAAMEALAAGEITDQPEPPEPEQTEAKAAEDGAKPEQGGSDVADAVAAIVEGKAEPKPETEPEPVPEPQAAEPQADPQKQVLESIQAQLSQMQQHQQEQQEQAQIAQARALAAKRDAEFEKQKAEFIETHGEEDAKPFIEALEKQRKLEDENAQLRALAEQAAAAQNKAFNEEISEHAPLLKQWMDEASPKLKLVKTAEEILMDRHANWNDKGIPEQIRLLSEELGVDFGGKDAGEKSQEKQQHPSLQPQNQGTTILTGVSDVPGGEPPGGKETKSPLEDVDPMELSAIVYDFVDRPDKLEELEAHLTK